MSILVSVCCITYNHQNYISHAIESFLMQETNFEFEIIIHDDASTDDTANIIRNYARRYPNIVTILQTDNKMSKNIDIDSSFIYPIVKGKYIAFCEGDDFWIKKDKLQKQVDYMEKHPQASMCFHSTRIIDQKNKHLVKYNKPFDKDCLADMKDLIVGGGGFCPTASLFFRKKSIMKMPEFYNKSIANDCVISDYPLQLYLATLGDVYYFADAMSAYRTNISGSWTSNLFAGRDNSLKMQVYTNNMLSMLDGFNEFTKFAYNISIEETKLILKFKLLVFKNKLKEIKKPPYLDIYKSQTPISKVKIHIKYYFPKASSLLRRIKKCVKFVAAVRK